MMLYKNAENWEKSVPKILEHDGEVDSEVVNELNMLKVIEIMDKSFHPLAAFTIHECKSVHLPYIINSCCVKLF